MSSVTFEEAVKCPRCGSTGSQVSVKPAPNRDGHIHTLRCENERCSWYNTDWIVQKKEDGTVPLTTNHPKEYPPYPGMTSEKAQDIIKRTIKDDER